MLEEELIEDDDDDIQQTFEHHRFTADKGQTPIRLDLFLMDRIERATRNKIKNAILDGFVLINDAPTKANYKIKPLDVVSISWTKPKTINTLIPQDIPIDVKYEDEDVMVVYKPAGMVAHPAIGHWEGTLANALAFRFQNMPLLSEDYPDRPGLVHRIDKNTTGLLLIAKSEYAMTNLAKQFFDHTVYRRYIALVWGDVKLDEGTVNLPIGRDKNFRKLRAIVENPDEGKYAITHYKVLKRYGYVTLIECRLETGRTHQIRVHMKHLGHPLFNDFEYGGDKICAGTVFTKYKQFIDNCFALMPHHTLHARAIGFTHPKTGEYMQFESPLPDKFNALLEKWDKYTEGRGLGEAKDRFE